jgi:hypothetical protein
VELNSVQETLIQTAIFFTVKLFVTSFYLEERTIERLKNNGAPAVYFDSGTHCEQVEKQCRQRNGIWGTTGDTVEGIKY